MCHYFSHIPLLYTCMQSTETGTTDAQQSSQEGKSGLSTEESFPGKTSMRSISKEFDEYFGNTLRCPDNRDVDHLIPEQSDSRCAIQRF